MLQSGFKMRRSDFHSSSDSQFTDGDDDVTFLEACMDCDEDALYDIIQDGVIYEQVNEKDRTGRTGLSLACANGFLPIVELLGQVEEVDPNTVDNEGQTPLIFAAQAGHADVVNFLLHNFRRIRVDQCNIMGFTALMKAAIQGRTRCAKLLLFSGANPNRRDQSRGLCAEEWARFCGRHTCADAIKKYVSSKKYILKKTFMMTREKWSSEPDLASRKSKRGGDKAGGNWISRHLSFKRKKGSGSGGEDGFMTPLEEGARSSSSPILLVTTDATPPSSPAPPRRPSCIDNVVPTGIFSKRKVAGRMSAIPALTEDAEDTKPEPPSICEPRESPSTETSPIKPRGVATGRPARDAAADTDITIGERTSPGVEPAKLKKDVVERRANDYVSEGVTSALDEMQHKLGRCSGPMQAKSSKKQYQASILQTSSNTAPLVEESNLEHRRIVGNWVTSREKSTDPEAIDGAVDMTKKNISSEAQEIRYTEGQV